MHPNVRLEQLRKLRVEVGNLLQQFAHSDQRFLPFLSLLLVPSGPRGWLLKGEKDRSERARPVNLV